MKTILIFILATVVNVSLSTVRSICTIKGGKWISAITNAICYGFYPLIVMLTAKGTVDIIVNMIITAVANFVCVWVIKFIEEKTTKDKLWKIEATFGHKENFIHNLEIWAKINHISYNYIDIGKYYVVNFYSATQTESTIIKDFVIRFNGKCFASESKIL
jgi:uncharacterized protein YebE (UPF0316 family)